MKVIKKVFLVSDDTHKEDESFIDLKAHIKIHYKVDIDDFNYKSDIEEFNDSHIYILYLNDMQIKEFFTKHINSGLKLGILPFEGAVRTVKSYGISKDIYEALDDCFDETKLTLVDLLVCNAEATFTNIVIGDVHGLNQSTFEQKSIFYKIKEFFINLKELGFKEYTLQTAKEQTIQTAATGIMVLEHNVKQSSYNFINEDFSLQDGKLNAFILAPTSIISYIYYLISVFFYSRFSINSMPKSIGIVKTSKLIISNPQGIDYTLDGVLKSSKELELEVLKDTLYISLGRYINNSTSNIDTDDKDTIKIKDLPKGDIKSMLLYEPIPFFKKANEDEFKDLFISLRDSAKLNSVFIVLMILSTTLATTGLFQSSAPVIIGAMILAPLMAPIVSLAMGVVRAEHTLLVTSVKTLSIGILLALLFSCIYAYFIPLSIITEEMRGRLNPNILDLTVAIISGIAGAYANSKSEVAKSLAGVAIAVALVPPLSVTGIGLGWMDFSIIYGSFLLFITNLVGITLSASLTFVVLGYSPITRAKKGIIYTSGILLLVTIPLLVSFNKLVDQNNILNKLNNKNFLINKKSIELHILDIDLSKTKPIISLITKSNDIFNKQDLKELKKEIENKAGRELVLIISSETIVE